MRPLYPAIAVSTHEKVTTMKTPDELKPALWGAVAGAAVLSVIGFTWGGWVTGTTAESLAKQKASSAVVAALAPICADNFRRGNDAPAQLVELKKVSTWEQANFVEKGGWAKVPGSSSVDRETARACAEMIIATKS